MTRLASLALVAALATPVAAGEFEQHYSPGEDLEAIDTALIAQARSSIDMAAYLVTDWQLQDDLVLAAQRGVAVRLVLDASEFQRIGQERVFAARLQAAGGVVKVSGGQALMHLKTMCLDGDVLRFGAANFSRSGLTEQANDLDIVRGSGVCDRFEATFERLWDSGSS